METVPETEDMVHSFCIGQHESNRQVPLNTRAIQFAHASNVSSGSLVEGLVESD